MFRHGHRNRKSQKSLRLDGRQITHLICVRLKYLLSDFCKGVFWAFSIKNRKEAQNTSQKVTYQMLGGSFFGIEMFFFFWYRGGLSLFFGIKLFFFGIEILYSVVQHLYRPLLGIKLSVLFWASTSCKVEVKEDLDTEKKIEKSRYPKKDISTPTKRVT